MLNNKKKPPRDIISKDNYYMMLAFFAASRSLDPSFQWGAYIIGDDGTPIASTCNGVADNIKASEIDWSKSEKYDYIFHAEDQAINAGKIYDLSYCTLYITAMPCRICMNTIVRSKLPRVVYFPSRSTSGNMHAISISEKERICNIAKKGNVKLEEFDGNLNWVRDQMVLFEAAGIFAIQK